MTWVRIWTVQLRRRGSTRQVAIRSAGLVLAAVLLAACSVGATDPTCPQAECPGCPTPTSASPEATELDLWCTSGHADAESEAFTHWDGDMPSEIPVECAQCHSKPGYVDFLGTDRTEAGQVDRPAKVGTTVVCYVCHLGAAARLDSVTFRCGARVAELGRSAGCVVCHQGRACTDTVAQAIAEVGPIDDDEVSTELRFVDSHAISAATFFGTRARGAYEYEGKAYSGPPSPFGEVSVCLQCHDPHSLEIDTESCRPCYPSAWEHPSEIRADGIDYDGDGNVGEGIAGEIETIHEALMGAIQRYARAQAGPAIVYDGDIYPYYFVDRDGDGEVDAEEASPGNRYNAWTPRLLKAAYNYNYVVRDPGGYAHNADYIVQILYDSLEDLGAGTAGATRPPVGSER